MQRKSSNALGAVLAVMAALLVVSGVVLFWVAWRGVQILRQQADHAATVIGGDASALAGKTDYVGTWTSKHDTLTIGPNGHADWSHVEPGSSEDMHGSLSFDGSDLVIDILVTKKHMHIDRPPHLDGTVWKMTLDGVELERK